MNGIIDGFDFKEMEPMKYYAPPATWTTQKKNDNVKQKVFSGQFLAAEKMDGYFSEFIKDDDGEMYVLSRTRGVDGTFPNKIEWVPQLNNFFERLPNGTCLLGELYLPSKPGSKNITTILGCLKDKALDRQEKGEKLNFYVFDCLAFGGVSYMDKAASFRFHEVQVIGQTFRSCPYVRFAHYVRGDELWDTLGKILDEGGEGMVLTHEDALYEPGKRPSKTTLKVKKEISETIDCFFTGRGLEPTKVYEGKEVESWKFWINTITNEKLPCDGTNYYREYMLGSPYMPVTKPYYYGWLGSLEIALVRGDKIVPIGFLSGLTDEIKSDASAVKGKVIEVSAMEIGRNEDGSFSGLRHAKMLGFREDKKWNECDYSQVE